MKELTVLYSRIHSKKIKSMDIAVKIMNALIKKKIKFSSYFRKIGGIGCEVIYNERLPHIWWKCLCISSYTVLGSPSSYMTLHPIPSEFPYVCGKFCFLFYQCANQNFVSSWIHDLFLEIYIFDRTLLAMDLITYRYQRICLLHFEIVLIIM